MNGKTSYDDKLSIEERRKPILCRAERRKERIDNYRRNMKKDEEHMATESSDIDVTRRIAANVNIGAALSGVQATSLERVQPAANVAESEDCQNCPPDSAANEEKATEVLLQKTVGKRKRSKSFEAFIDYPYFVRS